MRHIRLSTLLIAINVGLLLLSICGVAYVAVRLLEQLADEQALARVNQAGASARQAIASDHANLLTTAQLLAERPTLRRLLDEGDRPALEAFLAQFQHTSQLGSCAVLRDRQLLATCEVALPWPEIASGSQAESTFFSRQTTGEPLLMVAQAPVSAEPGTIVLVTRFLDQSFTEQISKQIGMPVMIVDQQAVTGESERSALRSIVIATGNPEMARLEHQAVYLSVLPLQATPYEPIGLVETELSTDGITSSLRQLIELLMLLALGVASLAALASLFVGRWLGTPLHSLTTAAARIGRGDLATPIPAAPGAEVGTLAATLEEMRHQLFRLTADLRRQQSEARAIVTGIVEGVFTVDRERRIHYLNPQAANMLGIQAEQAIGRFCGDVLQPQGPGGVRPCAEHCPIVHARFRDGARAAEHLLLQNGQRRTVVITSAPPAELQQVQVLRDETEIEATRRLRDMVLANISHEFRTPLSAQLASIELLLDQLPSLTTDQIGELVLSLQRGTLRLTQLIDNLLESVRIEAGQDAIRHQTVSLDEVVEAALELTQPLLGQRGQEALIDLPYPLPTITGDAQRLTQVLVNLLANANKFAPPGSVIRVGADVAPASVALWVEDRGPGLPPEADQSLFGRFVRAAGEEPEQSGMGLGLAIVKSIVERHGGQVQARSDNNGTRMAVILPRS